MALIVIGGHTRNIGKTSVVCGIISAMPDKCWTAIKITPHAHGETANHSLAITEERNAVSGTDSSRYLAAGAVRSLWVRTGEGQLAEAMPRIREEIAQAENVILESNSVLDLLRPDVYASVLNPEMPDFKRSALRYLDRADALLLPFGTLDCTKWTDVSFERIEHIPRFGIGPPTYSSPEFVSFIAEKMHNVGK